LIEVRNIRARSFDLDRLDLYWEISTTSEDPQDYDTYVLRSESPLGPYTLLTPVPLSDLYHFRDTQPGLLHNWRKLYYRLRLVHRESGAEREFPDNHGASVDPPLALEAMEAATFEEVLLREHTGRPCLLFKRRTFGPRCPHCYDARQGRQTTKRCEVCFGGTFMHGYHAPILFWMQIDPETDEVQTSSLGEGQEQVVRARCTFFPPIAPKDVVVEMENVRWRVAKVPQTKRLRSTIHQEVQLRKIPPGSIEFLLPVPDEYQDWEQVVNRDFTNPQTLEGSDGMEIEMDEILDIYSWRMP